MRSACSAGSSSHLQPPQMPGRAPVRARRWRCGSPLPRLGGRCAAIHRVQTAKAPAAHAVGYGSPLPRSRRSVRCYRPVQTAARSPAGRVLKCACRGDTVRRCLDLGGRWRCQSTGSQCVCRMPSALRLNGCAQRAVLLRVRPAARHTSKPPRRPAGSSARPAGPAVKRCAQRPCGPARYRPAARHTSKPPQMPRWYQCAHAVGVAVKRLCPTAVLCVFGRQLVTPPSRRRCLPCTSAAHAVALRLNGCAQRLCAACSAGSSSHLQAAADACRVPVRARRWRCG